MSKPRHLAKWPLLTGLNCVIAFAIATPSKAGFYQEGATVCGRTWPYKRGDKYGLAPGLFATKNDKGAVKQLMEIKRPLTISQGRKKMDVLADFLSAHEIPHIWMCIHGGYGEQLDISPQYAIKPRSFWFVEKGHDLVSPSQIAGTYVSQTPDGGFDRTVAITAIPDDEVGLRFRFSGLAAVVKTVLSEPCDQIDKAAAKNSDASPETWLTSLTRVSKGELKTKIVMQCSNGSSAASAPQQGPLSSVFSVDGEFLVIDIKFTRVQEQAATVSTPTIQMAISAERKGPTGAQFSTFLKSKPGASTPLPAGL